MSSAVQKIFIGKISKGLEQFYLPFNIDNDAFPTLYNAYAWRGRVKRKRGTVALGRLEIQIELASSATNWKYAQFALSGGAGNLLTISTLYGAITGITKATSAVVTVSALPTQLVIGQLVYIEGVSGMTQINGAFYAVTGINTGSSTITLNVNSTGFSNYTSGGSLYVQSPIVPGSISITVGANTYTEPATPDGTLVGTPAGSGTINYATGDITISGGGSGNVTGTYSYYPLLPVMGLEDFYSSGSQYPNLIAFDTVFAYQISSSSNAFYDVSYYKSSNNPVTWSGQNYQQFWSCNYQGAFWATNNNPGLHMVSATYVSGTGTTAIVMTLSSSNTFNLIINDYMWFNEFSGSDTINGKTGKITNISGSDYTVTFGSSVTASGSGKAQLLTSTLEGVGDGIRWYDGDPTGGTGLPAMGNTTGWVNFAPPLTAGTVSIDDQGAALYYLTGALAIVPFKDRLLFFSPYIQTSAGSPILLNDVVLWSWNGTPYYSSLTPAGQTYDVRAYYVDQTGFGGWLSAGLDQSIVSVSNNEDVLLVGFTGKQTRFVYTSNDLYPFLFYIINSELGSSATFSGITLDRGALTLGQYGLALTAQTGSQRIDLQIPNQVFQLNAKNNAVQRISGARDFYHEWVHFTFVPNSSQWTFPTQTLQYNYREETWALLYENFTTQGAYRSQNGYTWSANPWNASNTGWVGINETWSSGTNTALFPSVIAGNPQGFVVTKGQGTGEAPTGYITAILNASGLTQIQCNNHCVSNTSSPIEGGDYLYFSNCLGSTYLNGKIGQVQSIIDANNFTVDIPYTSGSYLGLGVFTRLSQPLIQTKQFPVYWNEGRKVRIGVQKYLMDYTDEGQVSVYIYLSQDPDTPWNNSAIVPSDESTNNSLVYSTVLYTCPEATNIGLTQFTESINNPSPIASTQYQIWHRINTSLIGDTFQIGIALNDAQMRNFAQAISEIGIHAMQFDVGKGPFLT